MTSEAVRLSAENKYNQATFAADKRSRKAECSARTGDSDSRVKLKPEHFTLGRLFVGRGFPVLR